MNPTFLPVPGTGMFINVALIHFVQFQEGKAIVDLGTNQITIEGEAVADLRARFAPPPPAAPDPPAPAPEPVVEVQPVPEPPPPAESASDPGPAPIELPPPVEPANPTPEA